MDEELGGLLFFGAMVLVASWLSVSPSRYATASHWLIQRGHFRTAGVVIRLLRALPQRKGEYWARFYGVLLASDRGSTAEALSEAAGLLEVYGHPPAGGWVALNLPPVWINAGRYREALIALRRYPLRPHHADREGLAICHVNRAEALHNLGRDDLALKLLQRIRRLLSRSSIGKNGALTLRAWILAQRGQPQRARRVLEKLDARPLMPGYAAEVFYTRALVELAAGAAERALEEAEQGLAASLRASSRRNGLFLLGRIEAARGNLERAFSYYEQGRAHVYRGQGGQALFELGLLRLRQSDTERARAAFDDAITRDPESIGAERARAELAKLASVSPAAL